jgi:hypothetical protein
MVQLYIGRSLWYRFIKADSKSLVQMYEYVGRSLWYRRIWEGVYDRKYIL